MKSERSGALKPDKLDLSCKANKCSHAETGDLSVHYTHETSAMKMAAPRRTHQATSSPRSDVLIPLRSLCSRCLPDLLQDKFQASKLDHSWCNVARRTGHPKAHTHMLQSCSKGYLFFVICSVPSDPYWILTCVQVVNGTHQVILCALVKPTGHHA